jgi:hypothetical protein
MDKVFKFYAQKIFKRIIGLVSTSVMVKLTIGNAMLSGDIPFA